MSLALTPSSLPPSFLRGGDVSEIPEVEAAGGRYSANGKATDPFELMRDAGWNFVRFRIWNAPTAGFCDKAHTLALAKRAEAAGMKISLDFHYSDWWADPGKQPKPAAWKGLGFEELKKALYDYTKDVIDAMNAQGTPPYMVQVGNEITSGMVWPDGKLDGNKPENWAKLADLLNAGLKAVRDAEGSRKIVTMIHLDRGGDNKGARWWFDNIAKHDVRFDTIGLSYYPFWHGTLQDLRENVNDLATRYGKDIYIVETAYPWGWDPPGGEHVYNGPKIEDGYAANEEGQAAFLRRIIQIIREIPRAHGKGILYWAPAWIGANGKLTPYSNLATFDHDGNALPAVAALGGTG